MERIEGKKLKIFFDDGEKVAWKEGVVTSQDDFGIVLENKQLISKQRIIRMEVE